MTRTDAVENNPIYLLSDVAVKSIIEKERLTPRLILNEYVNRMLNILKSDHVDARIMITSSGIILHNIFKTSIDTRAHEGILYDVIKSIERIHNFCAENKILSHQVIELNELMENIGIDSIKSGHYELARQQIYSIVRILDAHLKSNVPDESEICEFGLYDSNYKSSDPNKEPDYDKSSHWSRIRDDYTRIIYKLFEVAIDKENEDVVDTCVFSYSSIVHDVLNANLGPLQRKLLIMDCIHYFHKCILKISKGNRIDLRHVSMPVDSFSITRIADTNPELFQFLIVKLSDLVLSLVTQKIYLFSSFNEIGTVGRGCISKLSISSIEVEAIEFLCDIFRRIKIILLKENSQEAENALIEVRSQVFSFKTWLEKEKRKNAKVKAKILTLTKEFDKLPNIIKSFKSDAVFWPNRKPKVKSTDPRFRTLRDRGAE
ncbi:hypothetical protein LEP1GSC037_2621 [Leptospira interrogans str. 2006001854]|uniref:Uncharacterized protein n=1 Tax=Leptospira interrogans str. 2006001854 TaxID=1001590 RepID=M6GB67_LEPIR|nr:hypothetical protein LEP1GSC037_2621 [Leptospira interrogans str. 2006001854]